MCHFRVRTRLVSTTRPASVAESKAMPSARVPLLWACPMGSIVQAAVTSRKGDAQPQVDACTRRGARLEHGDADKQGAWLLQTVHTLCEKKQLGLEEQGHNQGVLCCDMAQPLRQGHLHSAGEGP